MNLIKKTDLIYIAGHNGMVGSAIKRQLLKNGYKNLITADKRDLNLLDFESVRDWFKANKPNIVILAAAKVGGIDANFKYPTEFILENLKYKITL